MNGAVAAVIVLRAFVFLLPATRHEATYDEGCYWSLPAEIASSCSAPGAHTAA